MTKQQKKQHRSMTADLTARLVFFGSPPQNRPHYYEWGLFCGGASKAWRLATAYLGFGGALGDDLFGHVARHLFVVIKFH